MRGSTSVGSMSLDRVDGTRPRDGLSAAKPSGLRRGLRRHTRSAQEVRQARGRALWAAARAVMRWVAVLVKVRHRNRACDVVKAAIMQCGEWLRLKLAMNRLMVTVTSVQHWARHYLALKHQRMEVLQAQWQRIEDAKLEAFGLCSAQSLGSSAAEAQQAKKTAMQQRLREGSLKRIDMKSFRIPPQERRAILSRYYCVALRKRLRIQTGIVVVMRRVVQSQREVANYLRQFDADLTTSPSLAVSEDQDRQGVAQRDSFVQFPPWWHLTEDVAVQLIALCAQDLRERGVKGFDDHPSQSELPGNPMYCGSLKEAGILLASVGMQATASAQMKAAITKRPSAMSARKGKSTLRGDIEEVFCCFTPRLREITEKQSLEYRASHPARAATPLADVA
eukprot:CAMPEP_0175413182 /NCGR_PEP_ID=MMETSP0095-20121207/43021_1 /TAXON_ID=311494 /ORGANISM="Alexandrium monilatum, Strain CCMP3105" /LENGTH=392 /DNA_ID=CAMNT_0016712213 /DNA_START=51 /DNA_END=1229 /DNA_ORIENTATION=+